MRIQPALLVLLAAGTGLVTGCRQAPSTAADFNGAWRGDAEFLNSTGRGNSIHEWSIDADPTGRMMVAVTWSMSADDNAHGYDFGGEAVKGDTEQLLGLIDYETGEFVAVETEEPGTVFGELLPDGRIRVRLAQPGEKPVVLHTTLTRTAR